MKPEEKKCGESCGCDATKNAQKNSTTEKKSAENPTPEKEEIKLDPTHFGDWQINGRAIDF